MPFIISGPWKMLPLEPDFGIIYSLSFIPQILSKKLSKAWHSASKESGHAGARDIVSIQELYPFLLKVFTPSQGFVFHNLSAVAV
jgi:hypothetical protein